MGVCSIQRKRRVDIRDSLITGEMHINYYFIWITQASFIWCLNQRKLREV